MWRTLEETFFEKKAFPAPTLRAGTRLSKKLKNKCKNADMIQVTAFMYNNNFLSFATE
jgi:hypothetical protein